MKETIKTLLTKTKKRLNNSLEARILLQHLLKFSYEELLLNESKLVSEQDMGKLEAMIARRLANEPIAYITGTKEFYGLDFIVTRDTLIPRPDSETLITAVLESYDHNFNGTIIDLGTGSGCLIITLLKHLPNAAGITIDISKDALEIAKQNAIQHHVIDRIKFYNIGWNNLPTDQKYDVIISNPPYIETAMINKLEHDVKGFEPITALDGGIDGLDCYRDIFDISKKMLLPSGDIFIEIGYNQEISIQDLAIKKGLAVLKTYQDLNQTIRCIKLGV